MTDGNTAQVGSAEPSAEGATKQQSVGSAVALEKKTGGLRRFLWLDERVAEAQRTSFGQGAPGFEEFDLARQARAGTVQIGEAGESSGAVLLLQRLEVIALIRSHLMKAGLPCKGGLNDLSAEELADARTQPRFLEIWNELTTVQQNALEQSIGPDAKVALVGIDPKTRRNLAAALRKFATGLAEPLEFEANRIGRVLFLRWARIGAAIAVCLGVLLSLYGAYAKLTAKPNIALGRPVTISSQQPGEGMDHTLLVDGDRTNLGFHTTLEANPYCTIDLGSVRPITEVVTYNRADCCQERTIPLQLLVSDDGKSFRKVAERREAFDVWSAKGLKVKGRYIRLQLAGSNFLHLSEVEVY